MGPCSTCGAHVNHRELSDGTECPEGRTHVPFEEFAKMRDERDRYLGVIKLLGFVVTTHTHEDLP